MFATGKTLLAFARFAALGFAFAGWYALVLTSLGPRIAVTVPAGFAVCAFLFSGHYFLAPFFFVLFLGGRPTFEP